MAEELLLHDAFDFKGGGERLVLSLCRKLNLDLAYGQWCADSFDLSDLPGQTFDLNGYSSLPGYRTVNRYRAFTQRTRFLKDYRTVIYSGINAPLAVHNHSQGRNIFYCHTPPRALYDLREYQMARLSVLRKILVAGYNAWFQPLYEEAVRHMDVIVANSRNTQDRLTQFLGLESVVVHPPCPTQWFQWKGQGDYYLSTARLEGVKRVGRVLEAFSGMPDKKLIVTSSGPEFLQLREKYKTYSNISFTGPVEEEELRNLIGNAIATLYIPVDEDFGMSPVESMAAGKPVIGVREGGLIETVLQNETGILLNADPSIEEIRQGVLDLSPGRALSMREACEAQAQKFDEKIFIRKMQSLINS